MKGLAQSKDAHELENKARHSANVTAKELLLPAYEPPQVITYPHEEPNLEELKAIDAFIYGSIENRN